MTKFRLQLTIALLTAFPLTVFSHSGGTNSEGCHAGSRPYHCHNAKKAPARMPARAETERSSGCNSNYSGCVPNASDVDCAGGGGNGPEYVQGPIRVTGIDIYGLDRDKDGIACEQG
jgi:hypothetical protein